jgi:malonate decarboxylase delta subunit
METLKFHYPEAVLPVAGRAQVGVVGSGDLEILLEPSGQGGARVTISTAVDGHGEVWKAVLDRFFSRYQGAVAIEINDNGATPGVVALRLAQAVERMSA